MKTKNQGGVGAVGGGVVGVAGRPEVRIVRENRNGGARIESFRDLVSAAEYARKTRLSGVNLVGKGMGGKPVADWLTEYQDSRLEALRAPDAESSMRVMLSGAANPHSEVRREMLGIRVEQSHAHVLGSLKFGGFYHEVETLAAGDVLYIENSYKRELRVGAVAQDGARQKVRVIPSAGRYMVPLFMVGSDVPEYDINDLYLGNVAGAARQTFDLDYDVSAKVNKNLKDATLAAVNAGGTFGAFDLVNANPALRTFTVHSTVHEANVPTTNYIVLGSNGPNTVPRLDMMASAWQYASQMADLFPDLGLELDEQILIPSVDSSLAGTDLSLATRLGDREERIKQTGQLDYRGKFFNLVPDNTLPSGVAYFRFKNRLPRRLVLKPSMDQDILETDLRRNKESRIKKVAMGTYGKVHDRVLAVAVQYKNLV